MRDHRIGLDLFNDVLDVLHRHGFTRGDDQHAGRAIFLIGDLARVYEGSQDHPHWPSASQAPSPPASPGPPAPEPGPAVLGDDLAAVTLTHAEVTTVLASLSVAAVWTRDRASRCGHCWDQSCSTCQRRLQDARTYDQMARQILHDEQAAPGRTQPARTGRYARAAHPAPAGGGEGGRSVTTPAAHRPNPYPTRTMTPTRT